jgi:hypothetical protein
VRVWYIHNRRLISEAATKIDVFEVAERWARRGHRVLAIVGLPADPARATVMGAAGRRSATERLSWDHALGEAGRICRAVRGGHA